MGANDYHFVTRWRVPGRIEDAAEVLGDPLGLPRWWPSVYLDVKELAPGDARKVGRVIELFTKGWLPYTLRWKFRVVENGWPHRSVIEAFGDFEGRGVWTLKQDGDCADIEYDWRIAAEKPLLKHLSFALKPFFRKNHEWAMARGEESLRLELRRRKGESVPPPPPPTPRTMGGLVLGLLRGKV